MLCTILLLMSFGQPIDSVKGYHTLPHCLGGAIGDSQVGKCGGKGFSCRPGNRPVTAYACRVDVGADCPQYDHGSTMMGNAKKGYSKVTAHKISPFISEGKRKFDLCYYVKVCYCEKHTKVKGKEAAKTCTLQCSTASRAFSEYYDNDDEYEEYGAYGQQYADGLDKYDEEIEWEEQDDEVDADLYWDLAALRAIRLGNAKPRRP
eukprot:91842_1